MKLIFLIKNFTDGWCTTGMYKPEFLVLQIDPEHSWYNYISYFLDEHGFKRERESNGTWKAITIKKL